MLNCKVSNIIFRFCLKPPKLPSSLFSHLCDLVLTSGIRLKCLLWSGLVKITSCTSCACTVVVSTCTGGCSWELWGMKAHSQMQMAEAYSQCLSMWVSGSLKASLLLGEEASLRSCSEEEPNKMLCIPGSWLRHIPSGDGADSSLCYLAFIILL